MTEEEKQGTQDTIPEQTELEFIQSCQEDVTTINECIKKINTEGAAEGVDHDDLGLETE